MSKTFRTLTDKPFKENYRVFVVKKLEEISVDLPKAIRISSIDQQKSGAKVAKVRRSDSSESGSSKRARTEKIATFEETLVGDVNPSMAEASAAKRTPNRKSSSLSPPKLTTVVENAKKGPEEKLAGTSERTSNSSSPPKPPTIVENAKKRPGGKSIGSTMTKSVVVTQSVGKKVTKPTIVAQSVGKKVTKPAIVTQSVGKKATKPTVSTQSIGKKATEGPSNVSSRKLKAITGQSVERVPAMEDPLIPNFDML